MSARPEQIDVVRQWVNKADNVLKNAVHTLTMEEDCPLDTVCFHAQQCVEKYLKAWLAFHAIDFPKSHDLTELAALLPDDRVVPLSTDDYVSLTDYAIVTRYPGDWEIIHRTDAERAVTLAQQMRSAIRAMFPPEVTDGR